MRASLVAAALLASACTTIVVRPGPRRDPSAEKHAVDGFIRLNGERTRVTWTVGDSFDCKSGRYEGQGTRLVGFNTLEAYGPVHRWGRWTREELYDIAKSASTLAASREWECTTEGEPDAYGRLLVDCPKLAREMVLQGVALACAVRGGPPAKVLDAMHQAQRARRGIWAKGVPDTILTSLHSRDEDKEGKYPTAANRVLDTQTGETVLKKHLDNYQVCEEVCDGDSCMVYVPYELRYKNQPPCLTGQ